MAELRNRMLYGLETPDYMNETLSVQFHITAQCDQNCKHCYLHEKDNYSKMLKNELALNDIHQLINEIIAFASRVNVPVLWAITGGDPMLSPYLWDVLAYIDEHSPASKIIMMGNSFHLQEESVKKLAAFGVSQYQISLDGLKETHDFLRKKGSFEDALRALRLIHDSGMEATVMFTVSKKNASDFLLLYRFLESEGYVDCLGLDRMIAVGNGKDLEESLFTALEYRDFLYDIYRYVVLHKPKLQLSMKDNLWKLLLDDLGLVNPYSIKNEEVCTGCVAGMPCIDIMADGTCYACPRIPVSIGKFPEQTFENILLKNELLPQIMDTHKYEGCSTCQLLAYCRGCLAAKFAHDGNIYGKDPNCWRYINE